MQPAAPAVRDLVLVGAGHSHVQVLRRFGMRPEPGIRLTVIAREVHTPYSGMLPGHVAGRYHRDQMHIDVARLARFADARLIPSEVTGLDLDAQRVLMGDRPALRYDILSLNTGGVPGEGYAQRSYVTPVKPIGRFLPRWNAVCEELARRPMRLVLVGGGPGSVELALAMIARFPDTARCTLVTADPELLAEHARAVRRRLTALLSAREVGVHTDFFVEAVEEDRVRARDGRVLPHDHVFWVTGVEPFAAFRDSGLATDPDGFVEVNDTLQSTSHPDVFAAGDAAGMRGSPRPKSGVFAVRQGPALADNLRRHALGRPLRRYRDRPRYRSGPRPDRYRGRSRCRIPGSLACIGPLGVGLEGLDRPAFHAPLPGTAGDGDARSRAGAGAGRRRPGRDALRGLRGQARRRPARARPAATAGPSGSGRGAGHR